jgi:hypothetical protein
MLTSSEAVAFLPVGVLACCARPCNACENVGYLPPRNETRLRSRSIGLVTSLDANSAR